MQQQQQQQQKKKKKSTPELEVASRVRRLKNEIPQLGRVLGLAAKEAQGSSRWGGKEPRAGGDGYLFLLRSICSKQPRVRPPGPAAGAAAA